MDFIRCSDCFTDEGLRILAFNIGNKVDSICVHCNSKFGSKLNRTNLVLLAERFFVHGTYIKSNFGGASVIEFNENRETDVSFKNHLKEDTAIFEKELGIGFYYHGPATWRIGEIEQLKGLQESEKRQKVVAEIFNSYRTIELESFSFYRMRINPNRPNSSHEYDAPPEIVKTGYKRLDSKEVSVLYGAFDVPVCLHECRVTKEDEIYIATLAPLKKLKFLDLTVILTENSTPFESLDLSIAMLFNASSHSYEICQDIAKEALKRGFDGIIYPSYYSNLQSGSNSFQTRFGLPLRAFPQFREALQRQIYPNIAIFGYPILDGKIQLKCINKLVLHQVEYEYVFGPVL